MASGPESQGSPLSPPSSPSTVLTIFAGPTYIAQHSADSVLSDFRPIKLQPEALRSLNIFVDELLFNVLDAARSLLPGRIKTGLLKLLPTTLGKEALLEAELELRAYWERTTNAKPAPAEQDFNLSYAVELMRLKCEAYSTLNDSDEDAQAEARLAKRMGQASPPKTLIAPAALYLTAILERRNDRHILTNVGRVATRDSSRTTASMQDLFVALCEDDAVYPLFKTMKGAAAFLSRDSHAAAIPVYEHVESIIKAPRPRRSKSISRPNVNDRQNTSSPLPEGAREIASAWSRVSSESSSSAAVPGSSPAAVPRPSMEKAKAIKLFKAHNRTSSDRDASPARTHDGRKSISAQSDVLADGVSLDTEDDAYDQEFDDLMRSGETMKVSLTPDRLRTMESSRGQQRPPRRAPQKSASAENVRGAPVANDVQHAFASLEPKHHGGRRPSLHQVDSIVEDEEPREHVSRSPNGRRQDAPLTPPSSIGAPRTRSTSTSGAMASNGRQVTRKSSLGLKGGAPPVSLPQQMRDPRLGAKQDAGLPPRTRKIQRNRESLDLDDIMNGSDGESDVPLPKAAVSPTSPGRKLPYAVSSSARDLISFLEEGPPSDPVLPQARAATFSQVSLTPTTKSGKGGNRLQRMISKLSLSSSDREKGYAADRPQRGPYVSAPSTPSGYTIPLPPAVQPVPPRIAPPAPISPPSSPSRASSVEDGTFTSRERDSDRDRMRKMSVSRKAVPNWETAAVEQAFPRGREQQQQWPPQQLSQQQPSQQRQQSPPPSQQQPSQQRLQQSPPPQQQSSQQRLQQSPPPQQQVQSSQQRLQQSPPPQRLQQSPPPQQLQQRLTPSPRPPPSPVGGPGYAPVAGQSRPTPSPVHSHTSGPGYPQGPAHSPVRGYSQSSQSPSPVPTPAVAPSPSPAPTPVVAPSPSPVPFAKAPSASPSQAPAKAPSPLPAPAPAPAPLVKAPAPAPLPLSPSTPSYTNGQGSVRGYERLERASDSRPSTSPTSPSENGNGRPQYRPRSSRSSNGARPASADSNGRRTSAKRPLGMVGPAPAPAGPVLAEEHALALRRMMGRATSADECRLLLDMFLAKAGFALPSPAEERYAGSALASPPLTAVNATRERALPPPLEHSVVEMFLGDGTELFPEEEEVEVEVEAAENGDAEPGEDADAEVHASVNGAQARYPYTPEHSQDEHMAKGLPTPPVDTREPSTHPASTPAPVAAAASPAPPENEYEYVPQHVSAAA
ncbi:hypothetical protein FA95DRAFT_1576284 [Auriscalpium vulgare]|uniref:Uncharacterized protein n=1 Tax=Auriscalpium vulgare TaxID=40419 RepID=A0ACB8RC91_9AGAM|nr:hypothetical protein FA95DRAFT_1576284 [Auriscalpium vulgare]